MCATVKGIALTGTVNVTLAMHSQTAVKTARGGMAAAQVTARASKAARRGVIVMRAGLVLAAATVLWAMEALIVTPVHST